MNPLRKLTWANKEVSDMAKTITIARGFGSGGRTIGKMLSEDLGMKYYDKDLIRLASEESGINERFFGLVDEKLKGSFLRKGGIYKGELISPDSPDFTSDQNLFNYQAKVLKELAQNESYICIGRAADFVLKDNERLITVFFHAPMENRIKRAMELTGFDANKAEQYIMKTDKYRREFYEYHTGCEWESPYNYDLCLNTGVFTYEECVDIKLNYINTRFGEK
jgi:cytidylate kinase